MPGRRTGTLRRVTLAYATLCRVSPWCHAGQREDVRLEESVRGGGVHGREDHPRERERRVQRARRLGGVARATGRGRDDRAIGSNLPHDHTADRSAPGPSRIRPLPSVSSRARREARCHVPAPAGQGITRLRVTTPRDYAASLDAIVALVLELERAAGGQGTVGVGIPGTVVPRTGLVKNANSTWLNGQPLERDLAGRLGRPVRVMNDANCFALSEATDGAAAGAHVVFGVILGTGVGGGIVVDGRCLAGANLIAGEWGHNPLPWLTPDEQPGPPCYCGKRGCVEA